MWVPAIPQELLSDFFAQKVHCTHGHVVDRNVFQDWLSSANPRWKAFADALEASGQGPRTNPDGDVCILTPSGNRCSRDFPRLYSKVSLTTTLWFRTVRYACKRAGRITL